MVQTMLGGAAAVLLGLLMVLGFLWLVRRRLTPERLKGNNEVVSAYGNVIGMTYAVILAFMLSDVWTNHDAALANTEQEATAVVQLFRLSAGLPPDMGQPVRDTTHEYVRVVMEVEWPGMARGEMPEEGRIAHDRIWTAVLAIHPRDPTQQTIYAQILSALTNVTHYRAIRGVEVRQSMPPILWWLLVVGGVITIGVFSLFGVEDWRLHVIKSVALTVIISTILVTIAEVDAPFQGDVHVDPSAFQVAHIAMDRLRHSQ